MKETDVAVLVRDMPQHKLRSGDLGAVVHVYPGTAAYDVEFVTCGGDTFALVTLPADAVRPAATDELYAVRTPALSA